MLGGSQGGAGTTGGVKHGVLVAAAGQRQQCDPYPFAISSKKKLSEKHDTLYINGQIDGPGHNEQTG